MSSIVETTWNSIENDAKPKNKEWWCKFKSKYEESERKYHNLQHLGTKLELLKDVEHLLKNKRAVELAVLFSYFEYDPRNADNVDKNIDAFKEFIKDCEISDDSSLALDVIALLEISDSQLTEEHKTPSAVGSDDKHYFLDLDMAVLGSSPEIYDKYSENVKSEYCFLPNDIYRSLRRKVLFNFLQIPNIFATKVFRDRFEEQARQNIQREINQL